MMADYSDIINEAAQRFNVDPNLIRGIIATESGGNANARSGVGAQGLMQIMPSNYKALGITDPTDPRQNIMGGAQMIAGLLDKYGDVPTALRHYQGGDDTSRWGPVNAAYPVKVLAAAGIGGGALNQAKLSSPQQNDAFSSLPVAQIGATQPQTPQSDPFSSLPVATAQEMSLTPKPGPQNTPGALESAAIGFGKGLGSIAAGAEQLLGKGASAIGLGGAGNYLSSDANYLLQQLARGASQAEQAHPFITGAGNIAGQMAGTLPIALSAGPVAGISGMMSSGAAQGAAMGALNPVLSNQDDFWRQKLAQLGTGAAVGAATPLATGALASLGGYAGNALSSLVRPFTSSGQQSIAENIINKAAAGGPLELDASNIVPGSSPTLAEATANPGIATLQRTIRDINPAPFVAKEQQNAAARLEALSNAMGTPGDIESAIGARNDLANQQLQALFSNSAKADASPVVNTIDSILSGPSGKRDAVRSSLNNIRGKLISGYETSSGVPLVLPNGEQVAATSQTPVYESDPAVLYNSVRKQINDLIDSRMAGSNPAGLQASRELLQVRDALDNQIDAATPGFKNYLSDYSNASSPIDAMKYLQGLNLTDAQGNLTLSKVQGALKNIQKQSSAVGPSGAAAIDQAQLASLQSIRDDLLRSGNTELGKTRAGSASGQNLAMQSMLQAALPGKLGVLASQLPGGSVGAGIGSLLGFGAGGPAGAAFGGMAGGRIGAALGSMANAQNDAIVQKLTNMMINPELASQALARNQVNPLAQYSGGLNRLLSPAIINQSVSNLSTQKSLQAP